MIARPSTTLSTSICQVELFPDDGDKHDTTSTFADNLALPVHRWYRYSAGFSAIWARELISQQAAAGHGHILDPFAGSGTVLLEGERCGVEARGIESHPYVARMAQAKLHWREDLNAFCDYALGVLADAKAHGGQIDGYAPLIARCFPEETLAQLDALRRAWAGGADGSPLSELTWLALASIIRDCSPVGTAQWQYVLPNKSKARWITPFYAFAAKIAVMSNDMATHQEAVRGPSAVLHVEDARACAVISDEWADLVVTSPPYANNYDYADATRLEMTFFRDIQSWGDLQESVRKHLIPSCTQHVSYLVRDTWNIVDDPLLSVIHDELAVVCRQLEAERAEHGGKKNYHTMIAAYCYNMAKVWIALRRAVRTGALVCFVVGDSAPYGVYVPVDKWLGELAVAAGFRSYRFEKTRDRNIKWKNRKHRVPLHEGRLWVRG